MICPICGKEGSDDAKFCVKCGTRIPRCPTCGSVLTKRVRFCLHDGTPIPEEIQNLFPENAAPAVPVVPVVPVPEPEKAPEEDAPGSDPAPARILPIPTPIPTPAPTPAPAGADGKPGKEKKPKKEKKVREKKEKKKSRILMVLLIVLTGLLAGTAVGAAGYMVWQNWDAMPWVSDSATEPSQTEADIATEAQAAESTGTEESLPGETVAPTEAVEETQSVVETQPETQPVAETAPPATEPPAAPVYVSTYEIIAGDLSWHEAKLACEERGGMLASINSAEEYQKICSIASESGLRYLWLGACLYSADDEWANATWLTGEPWSYEIWYPGEPSKEDADGTKEYYLCLWDAKYDGEEIGWTMNDQRSDIVADFPTVSGKIGYVCEYRVEVTE